MMLRRCKEESGIAMLLALALITLITVISVTLLTVTSGEASRSRRDVKTTSSYQAAESGTNAYLSDLTESTVFYNSYLAKGEATRTDSSNATHASSNSSDVAWSSGTTWTYATQPANDTGWFDLGNGYQYLIQVYPPNASLTTQAQVITRIDVIGRPKGSTDFSTWRTLETMIRPSSLTDFQTFTATSVSYAVTATTTGPIFVGEDSNGVAGTLTHLGTAKANLYSEGTATVGGTTLVNGAKKYDKNSTPTALCKLNNCNPVLFSSFQSTITTVSGAAAAGGITLGAKDLTNAGLSGQSYNVDAWKLAFQSNGTVLVSSCKLFVSVVNGNNKTWADYDGTTPPVCGTATSYNVPSNGAIYSAVDVLVSGVVKGKVTVASSADIVFAGNTTYNTNGADVLGLEAQGTLYVAQYAMVGNTLNLWAAELSLTGPFRSDPNFNNPSGTMNFNGSTAVYGDPSGAVIFTNQFSTRNYLYDNNLKFLQPPYWPTLGNAFTILVQREL